MSAALVEALPDQQGETYEKVWYWVCETCDAHNDGVLPDGDEEDYYDLDDLINDVTNWRDNGTRIKVGELENMTRGFTCTLDATVDCVNGCTPSRGNCSEFEAYQCPDCGEKFDDSHQARNCCLSHCSCGFTDCPDDRCLSTVRITAVARANGWGWCYCRGGCEVKVCLVCHQDLDGDNDDVKEHVRTCRGTETYDEAVKEVGKPASLPPAFTYQQEPAPATRPALTQTCAVCESEFCCETHGIHKTPHRGHG